MPTSTIWVDPPATSVVPGCGPDTGRQVLAFTRPLPVDLAVYRGDTGRFRVRLAYRDGTPIDVSAATWDADVRSDYDVEPPITTLTVTLIAVNVVEVVITAAQSKTLPPVAVWDLQMTLNGEVQTILKGGVFVDKDVSREAV